MYFEKLITEFYLFLFDFLFNHLFILANYIILSINYIFIMQLYINEKVALITGGAKQLDWYSTLFT